MLQSSPSSLGLKPSQDQDADDSISPLTSQLDTAQKPADAAQTQAAEKFLLQWRDRADQVEVQLLEHLSRWTSGSPSKLAEAIEYSLMAPGKRLRPLLALWAAETVCGDYSIAFPPAVAVEMIHCYSLIHDDLPAMDDDDLRRGRPTCHIKFDESTAILAGDALQPMAFAVLSHSFQPQHLALQACQRLSVAAGPVALVGGQADDLQAEATDWTEALTVEQMDDAKALLARIHARKTGAMIRVSLELGALAAQATSEQMAAIGEYGQAIGQSFQIVDDLLDVQSTPEQLGKRTGKDEAAGKLTYPRLYGVQESILAAKDYTKKAILALEMFGSRGESLIRFAETILERTH